MALLPASTLPDVVLTSNDVFPGSGPGLMFSSDSWPNAVTYFVGRNGSGKSRTAKLVADRVGGRVLSTDRLTGLMLFDNYGWTSVPSAQKSRGVPIGGPERDTARSWRSNPAAVSTTCMR